jgi:proteasome accessory factor C
MLPWVIAHPGTSVDEVRDRFGYTTKELTDDLNVVLVSGLPGYGPGDLMDAYIDDDEVVVDVADYFAASPRLTSVEALTLLAAGMALLSAGLASETLERGVAKLQRTLLGSAEGAVAVEVPRQPQFTEALRGAARSGSVVRITYAGLASDTITERSVEPWSVFSSLGNWYLRGHCRFAGGERVFRVDRITDLQVIGEHFEPPPAAEEASIVYSPGESDSHCVIELRPAARWVLDYYPVDVIEEDGEGATTIRFSASSPLVAARLLLRLGASARLVEGVEVAAEVDDLRRRIVTRYRG